LTGQELLDAAEREAEMLLAAVLRYRKRLAAPRPEPEQYVPTPDFEDATRPARAKINIARAALWGYEEAGLTPDWPGVVLGGFLATIIDDLDAIDPAKFGYVEAEKANGL
jgi:hypothetical protein